MDDFVEVERESGRYDLVYWPRCKIKGCPNRVCYGISNEYCYPHSSDGTTFGSMMNKYLMEGQTC